MNKPRKLFLFIVFLISHVSGIEADNDLVRKKTPFDQSVDNIHSTSPSIHVSDKVWSQVFDFLLPDDHPAKNTLDEIFSSSRAIYNMESMIAAGFDHAIPQHHTHIIVTRHPKLKGYVIKAYLDEQKYHENQPEHYYWIKRVRGSRLIQASIEAHHYESIFKVPRKWIYLLPDEPSPQAKSLHKMFILIEEDMNIYELEENIHHWLNDTTEELLKALYVVTTELGLRDCTRPTNAPYCLDGKIAFVDTQSFYEDVKFKGLLPCLSPPMKQYWRQLFKKRRLEGDAGCKMGKI